MTDSEDLRASLKETYREVHGPEPDEIDRAISALRSAREILRDAEMMRAIKSRQDENRKAIEQEGGSE